VNSDCFAAPTVPGQGGPANIPVSYGPAFFDSDLAVFKNFAMAESRRLQFRVQAYNFLNHPLYSFPNSSNLTLQYVQDPVTQQITQANSNFGQNDAEAGCPGPGVRSEFYF